jgi:hypothetical protein
MNSKLVFFKNKLPLRIPNKRVTQPSLKNKIRGF